MTSRLKEWWQDYHNLGEVYLWIILAVPTVIWWKESVLWVAIMSLYANAKTAHGAHEAEKAKKEAQDS